VHPHLIRGSLGPREASVQAESQSVQPFVHNLPVCLARTQTESGDADKYRNHATTTVRAGFKGGQTGQLPRASTTREASTKTVKKIIT